MSISLLHKHGFSPVGQFRDGAFLIAPEWNGRSGVYAWIKKNAETPRVVRVGIACGNRGFERRYRLYNRWLEGRFKPDNAREQAARHYMALGLGHEAEIWAVEVQAKPDALALEQQLRILLADTLDLDLMVKTSWIKERMNEWRASAASLNPQPELSKPPRKASKVQRGPMNHLYDLPYQLQRAEDWVTRAFQDLTSQCEALGLDATIESGPGLHWRSSKGDTVVRIHPKNGRITVGFPPGASSWLDLAQFTQRKDKSYWRPLMNLADVRTVTSLIDQNGRR